MADLPPKGLGCHRTGFTQDCRELVVSERCNRWLPITGGHPVSGEIFTKSDCIDNWTPWLLIEHTKQQAVTSNAVHSFRDEMVKQNRVLLESVGQDQLRLSQTHDHHKN